MQSPNINGATCMFVLLSASWCTTVFAGGDSSIIFSPGLSMRLAAFMFAIILIFTLVWEDLTQRIEYHLADQTHFLQMLAKVYRELMILGFISLAVVLSNEFHLIHDHEALIHFEFSHLLAFLWALVYVVNALVSTFRLRETRIFWDATANVDTEGVCTEAEMRMLGGIVGGFGGLVRPDKIAAKLVAELGTGENSWRPFWVSMLPKGFGGGYMGFQQLEWKILQRLFQRDFNLPVIFDYQKYLRLKLMEAMGHSLHVSVKTWSIVLGLAHILD